MPSRRRLAAILVAGPAGWLLAAAGLDVWGGRLEPEGPYDYVVVAGAGVRPDGSPSAALTSRTRLAVDLYERGLAPRIALTGGVGDWGDAESEVAADLARGWGVPDEALVLERTSTSTEENAAHLHALVGDARVLVVTDRYHALRCRRVFGRYFPEPDAVGATSPWFIRVRGSVREVAALAVYALLGRL